MGAKEDDIRTLVKDFEDANTDLLTRMDNDYSLYLLEPYVLDDESCNITSNEPRVMAEKIIQLLEEAKMNVKVLTPDHNSEKENLVEKLLFGMFNLADKNLRRKTVIAGRTLQSALVFYGAVFGFMIGRLILEKTDNTVLGIGKKSVNPLILPIYPRRYSYGLDGDGLAWCGVKTTRDPETIYSEYGFDVDQDEDVIDYWEKDGKKVSNTVVVGEYSKSQKTKLTKLPFVFVPVGSSPLIYEDATKAHRVQSFGESIFAGDRDVFPLESKMLTIWASLIEKSHKPSGFLQTASNRLKIEKLPWGTGELMPIGPEDKFIPITPPDIANSAPQFYNVLHQMVQKGGTADVEHGLIAGAEYPSGKSITALQEGKSAKLTPLLKALAAWYEDAAELICEQYEESGVKMEVNGTDSKGRAFYQEIKPKDVKKPWDISIKFVATSPEQEMANYAKAQVAKTIGLPDAYIYEKLLEMDDPNKPERQRLLQEAEMQNPILKLLHQLEAAKAEGKDKEADVIAKALMEQLNQLMQPQLPAPQPQMPMPQQPGEVQQVPQPPQGVMPNG